ncbi:ATP-binding protein [Seleniivibrio woodruffii]|uniref:ATP-binding protein n=1 Tax=Seleniivibrio woodruffii TaxID=1078050 RepID=UPI0039E4A217
MSETIRKYAGTFTGTVLLGLLGYFANLDKFELFFNVDFLFGGVFSVIAIKRYGLFGVISAAIAAAGTYVHWNHPYAVIIFTAEALALARFYSEREDIILIDVLYWLTGGLVLVFFFYSGIMGMSAASAAIVYLKQSINGIINTLIASVALCLINLIAKEAGLKHSKVPLRSVIFGTILLITVLPMVFYIISNIRHQTQEMQDEMRRKLTAMTNAAVLSGNNVFVASYSSLNILAANLKNYVDETGVNLKGEDHITAILSSSDTFLGMGFINRDKMAAPLYAEEENGLKRYFGNDYSDRPYYAEAAATDKIIVTEARKSNLLNLNNPILILVKAMRDDSGEVIGYVQGGIQFRSIYSLMNSITSDSGIFLTLTDINRKRIISTNPAYQGMASIPVLSSDGIIEDFGDGIYLRTTRPQANTSVMTRWNNSYMIKSVKLEHGKGMVLTAEMPMTSYVKHINQLGFQALTVIYVSIIISVLLAFFISRRAARHLKQLSDRTAGISSRLDTQGADVWPNSIFSEVTDLSGNFRHMEEEITDHFRQISMQKTELEVILDSIPLIVFLKDTKNHIIFANMEAKKHVLFEDNKKMHTRDIFGNEHERFYSDDKIVMETKRPLRKIVQSYPFSSGHITVLTDKIPLLKEDGTIRAILVISRDITEELKAQEEKQRTLEVLYQQSKMAEMGAMIGAIAHQWKQPLNSIALITQLIEEDASDDTVSEETLLRNTGVIMRNIEFMSQTVNDFTGFFKQTKTKEDFKPCETVTEVYGLLDRQFVKNGIEVRFHEHKHFSIHGIKNEFKQVCLNILNNAKEALIASGNENKRIDVYYEHDDLLNKIIIEDNGGGIPEHLLPSKLFEMYSTTKDEGGTGLGLYICKSIIEEHMGGKIVAENTLTGARFIIMLPADGVSSS